MAGVYGFDRWPRRGEIKLGIRRVGPVFVPYDIESGKELDNVISVKVNQRINSAISLEIEVYAVFPEEEKADA